jgi:hypothetical protein
VSKLLSVVELKYHVWMGLKSAIEQRMREAEDSKSMEL